MDTMMAYLYSACLRPQFGQQPLAAITATVFFWKCLSHKNQCIACSLLNSLTSVRIDAVSEHQFSSGAKYSHKHLPQSLFMFFCCCFLQPPTSYPSGRRCVHLYPSSYATKIDQFWYRSEASSTALM